MKKNVFLILSLLILLTVISLFVYAADPVYFGTSIRSLGNPYHASWKLGGEMFAESLGMKEYHRTLLSEGNSEKQLDDIKALIAAAGKDVVFNVDPNQAPDVRPITEVLEKAGVYYVTQWNKPADMHPWQYKYWVAHISYDDFDMGYQTAKALIEAMGGKGKIVAIEGLLANTASQNRFKGLQKAIEENSEVELLDHQPADWLRIKAFEVTQNFFITYPDIDGVWCGDDGMAMGALEAVRDAGLVGQVGITGIAGIEEVIAAIKNGEIVATSGLEPCWQGGMGLAMAYKAYLGDFDPSNLPNDKREFYLKAVTITQDNVDWYVENFIESVPEYDWFDLWANYLKPMN